MPTSSGARTAARASRFDRVISLCHSGLVGSVDIDNCTFSGTITRSTSSRYMRGTNCSLSFSKGISKHSSVLGHSTTAGGVTCTALLNERYSDEKGTKGLR